MALSDGTKRFKTYGKHRSQVAVSHREWWSTVSETVAGSAASTSTAGQDSPVKYGKDGTSPSRRAAKKASSALVLDEDDEDDQKDIPAPKKQVPPPRAQSKSTNVRPRIVDIDDSDSDEEYRPSTSGNGHKASITASRSRSTAETPANKPIGSAIKAPDQQHGRVISLSSDTSEEDRLKPARRKPSVAKKAAPLARKRIIVEDTPPASPAVDSVQLGHVHNLQDSQGTGQLAADPAARESHLLHTLSMHTSGPVKPSVLTRKDSNYHNKAANAASLPLKKEAAVIVSTPVDHTSKHNIVAKESFHPSIIAKANTALKGSMSDKPAHTPMRVASSSQPPAHRLPSGITHARSLALRKQSSSSSSKSISLPPPRGHHSESVVTWRRPLVPIVPGSKGGSRAIKTYREQSSSSVLAEKMASAGRNYGSASSASSRSSNAGVSSQSSKSTHVVVEVPFGLPRSRSPAPVLKEARRRQTSVQSISSSSSRSSAMSSHEPSPVSSQRCESKSVNQTIPSTGSEDLVNSASQLGGTEKQDAATIESFTDIPKIPVLAGDDVPTEFIPLLEHCDGFQPSAASKVLDFTSFVASPIPLLSATPELPTSVRWRKLGEATFSEVFMVSEESLSTDSKAERGTVVKVIPLHMSPEQAAQEEKVEEAFAKGDNNVEEAFTSSIEDLAREIRIFRALSLQTKQARKGWPAFKGAYIVRGQYPERLLSEWDSFKKCNPKRAENPRPDTFAANQMFALICMNHAGVDLESVKLKTWSEAATILWQVATALSEAEATLNFEHRDLHWGNILVQRLTSEAQEEDAQDVPDSPGNNLPECLRLSKTTVSATIIDFTLSRATVPRSMRAILADQVENLSGGFDDEWMFTGEGDYQYECYRIMKRLVQGKWELYCPATNLVWLHYLVKKLLHDKGLKKPVHRAATRPAVIKASLPGTPLRNRTRRGTTAVRKVSKTSNIPDASNEKLAHESLLAAEAILGEAIASALQDLPRSSSLVQMMDNMRLDTTASPRQEDKDQIACAGDFLSWWREL